VVGGSVVVRRQGRLAQQVGEALVAGPDQVTRRSGSIAIPWGTSRPVTISRPVPRTGLPFGRGRTR
jgi:hypothetical protein